MFHLKFGSSNSARIAPTRVAAPRSVLVGLDNSNGRSSVRLSIQFHYCPGKFRAASVRIWRCARNSIFHAAPIISIDPWHLRTGTFQFNSDPTGQTYHHRQLARDPLRSPNSIPLSLWISKRLPDTLMAPGITRSCRFYQQIYTTSYIVSIIPIRMYVLASTPVRSILSRLHAESYTRRSCKPASPNSSSVGLVIPLDLCCRSFRLHKNRNASREYITRSTTYVRSLL